MPGEIACIMGPSGSGKSTLLSAICGTLDPLFFSWQGAITLRHKPIHNLLPELRQTGILFQDDLLFPHLTVEENLSFAISSRIKKKERQEKIASTLALFDLAEYAKSYPAHLSGGQSSRVALARALLGDPHALLLDEPFGNLDTPLQKTMQQQTLAHIRSRQLPSIMVTHDLRSAIAMQGKIFEIKCGELIAKKKNLV